MLRFDEDKPDLVSPILTLVYEGNYTAARTLLDTITDPELKVRVKRTVESKAQVSL